MHYLQVSQPNFLQVSKATYVLALIYRNVQCVCIFRLGFVFTALSS